MTSFPVIFYDGEQETSLGDVLITSSMNFKVFESIISEKLVLSPHQFSVFLSDRGTRIPVTGKINFSAISPDNDSFFLVVLKRSSKRDRRRKSHDISPPASMMLLRKDGNSVAVNVGFDRFGFEKRVQQFEIERERYLMNMGLGMDYGSVTSFGYVSDQERNTHEPVVCEECVRAKEMGLEIGFHCCVFDAVTFGFKSPAGPITRPGKDPVNELVKW